MKLYGNTTGLKANQLRRIENLYRRRIPPAYLITPELARDLCLLSHEIGRQLGILVDRQGRIVKVITGDQQSIVIPDLSEYRSAPGRLKGIRCIHTHLKDEPLTIDDLTDLALLRLDLMAAITMQNDGLPFQVHLGHMLPGQTANPYQRSEPLSPQALDIGCLGLIQALEAEMAQVRSLYRTGRRDQERGLLVSVTSKPKAAAQDDMDELRELARSGGIAVVGEFIQQHRQQGGPLLLGSGKLKELAVWALQKGVTLIVFNQELTPAQIRSITDQIDIKVIDRTQLILDIFAQRARSREGKLQVELAQLRYRLPRLITKNTAMSRLTGGIGGRGPGETKLEINRRRTRARIGHLEKALLLVAKQRHQQKARRAKKDLPIISIVGYTNAGKSTLLNTLTKSHVMAEARLFATLDPSSRRLRFPRDLEVIITDTVGFIKNLPDDLLVAFRATLEELESADLLLHVIDIGNPRHQKQIATVEKLVDDLGLKEIPMLRVLNKRDLLTPESVENLSRLLDGIPICAKDTGTLRPLIERLEKHFKDRVD
jgi:GTP-binding protein HflX